MRGGASVSRGITFRAKTRWIDRQIRTCRSLHHCEICKRDITVGQRYFDGGYSKRAHESCVDVAAEKAARNSEQAALGAIVRAVR